MQLMYFVCSFGQLVTNQFVLRIVNIFSNVFSGSLLDREGCGPNRCLMLLKFTVGQGYILAGVICSVRHNVFNIASGTVQDQNKPQKMMDYNTSKVLKLTYLLQTDIYRIPRLVHNTQHR